MNEIELLIMVRPELVDALDPHEVPPCGPGQFTTSPSDCELFFEGYNEVPKCCNDGSCPECRARSMSYGQPIGPMPSGVAPNGAGAMRRQPAGIYPAGYRGPAAGPASPAGGVPARPVSGPTQPLTQARLPNNPYGGNNPAPVVVAPDGRGEPEYFGPRGYDVIEYKKK